MCAFFYDILRKGIKRGIPFYIFKLSSNLKKLKNKILAGKILLNNNILQRGQGYTHIEKGQNFDPTKEENDNYYLCLF